MKIFKSFTIIISMGIAAVGLSIAPSKAALVNVALADNAFITQAGFDWAWAHPLPSTDSRFDLSFQSQFGWRIPTLAELGIAPDAVDFIFAGANVPLGGFDPLTFAEFTTANAALNGAAACATPYFSTGFRNCDWHDGQGQLFEPWAGLPGAESFADQLVIRNASVIPLPAALPLFLTGLAGLAFIRRRRQA